MAKAVTEDQIKHRKRARQRLIGAVALVLLAVIILPLALDHEPAQLPPELAIKTPADANFSSRVVPVPETPPPPATSEINPSLEKPQAPAADAPPATPASPPAPSTLPPQADKPGSAKSALKPAPSDKKPPSKARGDAYAVQLESFANAANARQLQEKLSANGVKSYTEVVETRQGKLTRVRVGPFSNREAAEQALAKLKALGFNGVVRP